MTLLDKARYTFMKDVGSPVLLEARDFQRRRRPRRSPSGELGAPLQSARKLRKILTRHYYLARHARGARPVAWVTSGAPVELLRAFGFYTVYPENHGALCGAQRMGPDLCGAAEAHGYHRDLCSYARIDLGHAFSGQTPAGKLPRPDLLFCCTNICQTVLYWYRVLAHYWNVPLLSFDTPYNFETIGNVELDYMTEQLKEMIPELEQISGRAFSETRLSEAVALSRETAQTWGRVLNALQHRPAPMTVFDAFVHMAPIVSLRGLPVTLAYYQGLLAELEDRIARGIAAVPGERRRLLWDNIAVWFKLSDWSRKFARRGCSLVAATYTNAWAETIHYLDHGSPWESMARAYSLVILNNRLGNRLSLMERMIRDYAVDGLVMVSLRSCKPYSVGQYDLKQRLAERCGIPILIIESDMTDFRGFSEEQGNTRLEAFFEEMGV